ncbi:hypothetical protein MJ579_08880 [Klebsiella pneumoniae]|nr:hypothetical protein MJ579_08880 [Klebsiella pneumoniae]
MRVFEAETLRRGLIEAATRSPTSRSSISACRMVTALILFATCVEWSQMPGIVLSARGRA